MPHRHQKILEELELCRIGCCKCFDENQEKIRELECKIKELKRREAFNKIP